jgi:DNA mismatch repair ATPase MutS
MISPTIAKKSSVSFTSKSNHSLLTGPNRGGKSSNLRAILQCVLWAQTYGVTPATSYKGKLFDWIISSLRVEDRPGTSSLFEREIEIATSILKRNRGRGLVLIDEIFHSTNPPDGEKSARIFLEKLWKKKNILSCVSTHVYSIVETSPTEVQKLCAYAEEDGDNSDIWYSYILQTGICKVSSVNEVLREKGLVVI